MSNGLLGKERANQMNRGARAPPTQGGHSQVSTPRRGNKTLGWYISDKILDKRNDLTADNANQSLMKNDNRHNPPALGRKGSLDQRSPTSTNSPKGQFEINNNNIYLTENASFQKRNGGSGNSNRPRANSNAFIPNDGRKGSGNVTFGNLPINNSHNSGKENRIRDDQSKSTAGIQRSSIKEDYWYYDAASDGFYYEHNGTRGWRKRNPKLHSQVPIALLTMPNQFLPKEGKEDPIIQPEVTNSQQFQMGSKITTPARNFSTVLPSVGVQPLANIKYYDAATDGFYYEMASVDGWRRRQPTAGTSPPSKSSSNQLAQQKIGLPIHQGVTSIASIVQPSLTKPSLPLQFQSYIGGHQSQLTNAELEEIILKHSQSMSIAGVSNTHKSLGTQYHQQHHATNYRQPSNTVVPPANTLSSVVDCCCCQAAAAAQMLIQDRMQQILLSGSNNTPQTVQNKQCGCRCGSSKNRDHQFSSSPGELSIRHGLNISPSPISSTESAGGDSFGWQFSSEPRHNSVGSQIDKWRKASDDTNTSFLSGEQYPFSTLLGGEANRSNDAIGENIAQNVQSKVLASSFEEPYEFYWSDSDARSNNSIASVTTTVARDAVMSGTVDNKGDSTLVGTSVSSTDELDDVSFPFSESLKRSNKDGAQAQNNRFDTFFEELEPKIGFDGDQQKQSELDVSPKRPDSLSLRMMKSSANKETLAPTAYLPYFNVDKFIADLPTNPCDPEKVLYNLASLRTPVAEGNSNLSGSNGKLTSDSPLFTPIFHKENVWSNNNNALANCNLLTSAQQKCQTEDSVSGAPLESCLLNNIKQIWCSPTAF